VFPGLQGGPLVHVIAAKAVAFREAATTAFREYQQRVVHNAERLCKAITAGGLRVVSGGTDNHLFLVDVFSRGITGADAEQSLEAAGLTTNKNTIPFDQNPPMKASGIRVGTPAVTTRGMGLEEMDLIGRLMVEILTNPGDDAVVTSVRQKVQALCRRFPLPYRSLGVRV